MKTVGAVVVLGALVGSASADGSRPQTMPVPQATVVSPTSTTSPDSFELLAQAAALSNAGDHLGAAELFEQVYRNDADLDLLVTIGGEYRKAGLPNEALQNLCTYLTMEPNGQAVALATSEAASIEIEQGKGGAQVCSPAQPMLPPIDPPSVQRTPPSTNSSLAQPFFGVTTSSSPRAPLSQRELGGIVTGALGLVGLGVGAYYGIVATDISDQISSHSPNTPWPADIRAQQERGQRAEHLENTFLLSGAVVTALGAYLYVTGHEQRVANERISVSPALLQQGGGIAVSGGF